MAVERADKQPLTDLGWNESFSWHPENRPRFYQTFNTLITSRSFYNLTGPE